jgi:hypothetical protein
MPTEAAKLSKAAATAVAKLAEAADVAIKKISEAAVAASEKLKDVAMTTSTGVEETAATAAEKVKAVGEDRPAQATTTSEQNTVTAGQRRINLIWEITQGVTAVGITAGVIYCQIYHIPAPVLDNAFFLIVSMYFVRTNHTLVGGVGPKIGDVVLEDPTR